MTDPKMTDEEIVRLELSDTQERVLLFLGRQPNRMSQIAGHGRAPWLSAARALSRKGLAASHLTGDYYLTKAGLAAVKALKAVLDQAQKEE